MADTKISGLSAVTSLTSTDELVLARAGTTKKIDALYMPGFQIAYVEFTSPVTISATSEATADSVVSAGSVTFDGSTVVIIEFFAMSCQPGNNDSLGFALYDGSSSIGKPAYISSSGSNTFVPVFVARKLTPSAASHTYSIRAYRTSVNATVYAGTGGAGNNMPGYIRIIAA